MQPKKNMSPFLEMKGITKNFGPTKALDDVNFDLNKGEVHALLGENGAGKSTLVKILSGALKQDSGSIFIQKRPFIPAGPAHSRDSGISMIYQELNLVPHLTVEENIMLGQELHRCGVLSKKKMMEQVSRVLEWIRHPEIIPGLPVKNLSVGARQIVEIARALVQDAGILIMDEPTSCLSHEDCERLFAIIKGLKAKGVSIIYISHFLEEVQHVADRYTVLRDGRNAGEGQMRDVDSTRLIRMMIGRPMTEIFPRVEHKIGAPLLKIHEFRGRNMKESLDFELCRGEILGVAGLIGSGRTETLRALFGLDRLVRGKLVVGGEESGPAYPWTRIRQGMGLLSEDRQGEGLALSLSVKENLTLSRLSPYTNPVFLKENKRRNASEKLARRFKIKIQSLNQPLVTLSGGNQQKVAMARLVHQNADILLLDEPTKGIDVASKSQVYLWMGKMAAEGKAVLFVSSYLPELMGVCDRIAVFHRGRIVDVRSVENWDAQAIMSCAILGSPVS
jgi:ribose transport system ATP-binding protein